MRFYFNPIDKINWLFLYGIDFSYCTTSTSRIFYSGLGRLDFGKPLCPSGVNPIGNSNPTQRGLCILVTLTSGQVGGSGK